MLVFYIGTFSNFERDQKWFSDYKLVCISRTKSNDRLPRAIFCLRTRAAPGIAISKIVIVIQKNFIYILQYSFLIKTNKATTERNYLQSPGKTSLIYLNTFNQVNKILKRGQKNAKLSRWSQIN